MHCGTAPHPLSRPLIIEISADRFILLLFLFVYCGAKDQPWDLNVLDKPQSSLNSAAYVTENHILESGRSLPRVHPFPRATVQKVIIASSCHLCGDAKAPAHSEPCQHQLWKQLLII